MRDSVGPEPGPGPRAADPTGPGTGPGQPWDRAQAWDVLLYTSDAADELRGLETGWGADVEKKKKEKK